MWATNRKQFGELVIGLAAIVAAGFTVAAVVWVNIGRMQAAQVADVEARNELAQDTAVLVAMADRETDLRRFLVTGDPQALQSYEASGRRFDDAMWRLRSLVSDDPAHLRRAATDIARQAKTWTDAVATPAIAAAEVSGADPRYAPPGQAQMDAIGADVAQLRLDEERLLAARDAEQAQAFRSSRIALAVGSLLGFAFSVVVGGQSLWRLIAGRRAAEATAAELASALQRAHAAEQAKTLFLANMSHEMRTPLNGVSGMAEALGRTELSPTQRDLLGVIRMSATKLDGLIGDLLTLCRGGQASERPKGDAPIHLGHLMRTVAAEHRASAESKGLALHAVVGPETEVQVMGDAARLQQLLSHLLSNAVKFTDRGEVRLGLEAVTARGYRFAVSDTGVGFDEARKAELFETFTQSDNSATRRHGGAGLGLALAHQLATELGGQLDCHSRPGEGSVFTFDIDLPSADAEPSDAHAEAVSPVGEPAADEALRMLVVDDNATNRKVLELILDQLGVEWVSVEDGRQAVEAVERQAFAAILMDIQMPVMDGLTATREIRRLEWAARRPATPVIIVSANGQPEHVEAGRAAGAQLHLVKPVNAQALVDALNTVLADPAPDAEDPSTEAHATAIAA